MWTMRYFPTTQFAFQVAAAAVLFLLARSDAYYYSAACNLCKFNTSGGIQSEHIYNTYWDAEAACKEKCAEGCGDPDSDGYYTCMEKWARERCETRVGQVQSNVTELGAICEFGDGAVNECVNHMIGHGHSCQVWCSATEDAEGLYAYHSSWEAYFDVWGRCQGSWECENCEYNLGACVDTAWCLHAWGSLSGCTEDYDKIIPVDEVTEGWYSSECHWDELCIGILCEACFQEWSVCRQWCSLSQMPKCDADRELCYNECHFIEPIIFSETSALFDCPNECEAEFDACVSSGDYDNACPVELVVESGGTEEYLYSLTRCAQIALHPSGEGNVIYEEICYNPALQVPLLFYKFWLPEYFNCEISEMHLLAETDMGWFINDMSISVGEQAEFRPLNLTNPITQLTGLWLDGEPYNSIVTGFPENKEWIFSLDEPVVSFPRHKQFEIIFIANSTKCCGGYSDMWPILRIFPADSGDTISVEFKLRTYWVDPGDIISVQIGGTEDAMATGGIEKFQLEATSTDGWFIERMYAKLNESFSEIDLFHVETGTRGIWLDEEPFDSHSDYGNTPTVQYYNVSNLYTFYEPSSATKLTLATVPPTSPPTTTSPVPPTPPPSTTNPVPPTPPPCPTSSVPPTPLPSTKSPVPPTSPTPGGVFGQILNAIASLFELLFGWLF